MGRIVLRARLDFDAPIGETFDVVGQSDPPEGPGWLLWSTYFSGPLSPVFADSEALVQWMTTEEARPPLSDRPLTIEQARRMIVVGETPTAVYVGGEMMDGSTVLDE